MSMFNNAIIQAPDGTNMSRCGWKKIKWYIARNLADMVSDDPPTIRLRFEPSGRSGLNDPLLLAGKPNICVVCGSDSNLTRHHIVPYCFIRHMDIKVKIDSVKDIHLLCRSCHNSYEVKSTEKKIKIGEIVGISIHGITNEESKKEKKAIWAASSLLNYGNSMPNQRIEELENIVKEFLKKDHLVREDIEKLEEKRHQDNGHTCFANIVVKSIKNFDEFAKEWRTHFVTTMCPKYMPECWSIDRISKVYWIPKKCKINKLLQDRMHSCRPHAGNL